MIENELIKIWQSSSNEERLKFERSKLIIELQSSLVRLHTWWKYMELIEVVSVIIGVLSFSYVVYWIPFTTSKIASVLLIILLIHILIQLLSIKKNKPNDLEENYLEYLKKTKAYLKNQERLLKMAVYWFILPVYPILVLFLIGFWHIPEKRSVIVITYLAAIVIGIYGYFLNKKRVKNEITPRIAKVEELIKTIKN